MTTNTAIVTGGSRGFGRAATDVLTRAGWRVLIDGRDAAAVAEAARATGAIPVPGDVTDAAHRRDLVTAAGDRLNLLVNNAGALGPSPLPRLADYPVAELRAVLEANLVAPVALTQLALPLLRAAGGAVVNLTSDAAVEAYDGWGGYGASKAALELVGRVFSGEEPRIVVWSLDPGDLRTAMHQAAFPGQDIHDRPLPEAIAPALLRLLELRPPSGRVSAGSLLGAVAS